MDISGFAMACCNLCTNIISPIIQRTRDIGFEEVDLGTWGDYTKRTTCTICCWIVRYFVFQSNTGHYPPWDLECRLCIYSQQSGFWITASRCDHSNHGSLSLLPQKSSFRPDSQHYIESGYSAIDERRIRTWASYCDSNHGGQCHGLPPLQSIELPSSLILIDVMSQCLIKSNGTAKYLALSYVWGQISGTLELNRTTANKLFDIGIFGLTEVENRLSKTIRDAMRLTNSLDIRYLWVDRLCIIQDDPDRVEAHLQQMASIYASAYFTIIALDGKDANHGLKGLASNAEYRRYTQTIFQFPGPAEALVDPPFEKPNTPWHQRGWTFQERVVSRRCLGFQDGTLFWHCRQAKWWEEIAAEPEDIPKEECLFEVLDNQYSLNVDPWPNDGCYWTLVESYTKRTLTFETDAPRAFTAVIDVMSRSFPGGFHWGIPAFYFDRGLLWRSQLPLQRRGEFPSWSWIGWKGEIHSCHLQFDFHPSYYHRFPRSDTLQTNTNWHVCKNLEGERIEISNLWQKYYAIGKNPSAALPNGWFCREIEIVDSANGSSDNDNDDGDDDDDDCDDYDDDDDDYDVKVSARRVFHHQLLGDSKLFAYPVPVTETPLGPFPDTWSPFLCFSTTRQQFVFDGSSFNPFPQFYRGHHCLWINLQSLSGTWAGVIESNFTMEADVLSLKGLKCETILISVGVLKRRSREYHELVEMDICDAIKLLQVYEFYNVLWIEWLDGIAHRKAIGRIWKEAWDMQTSEKVEVILG